MTDYTQGSLRERLTSFLKACNTATTLWRRAAIVGAISTPEVGGCIIADRQSDGGVYPFDCWPTRPVLAVERGSTRLGTNFPKSWTSDETLMAMLKSHDWVASNGKQLKGEADKVDSPQTGHPNMAAAFIFEWIMDQRKGQLLEAFSIGPTQMYLAYSPLANGKMANRFPDWDSLWTFYTTADAGALSQMRAFDYLGLPDIPRPSDDDETIQNYLSKYQVGRTDWSTDGRQAYLKSFKSGLSLVESIAKEINYDGWGV